MALEQEASPHRLKLRVPRCIAYKEPGTGMNLYSGGVCSQTGQAGRSSAPARCQVNVCSGGWKVRTAMTLVPGQSLDYFLRPKWKHESAKSPRAISPGTRRPDQAEASSRLHRLDRPAQSAKPLGLIREEKEEKREQRKRGGGGGGL